MARLYHINPQDLSARKMQELLVVPWVWKTRIEAGAFSYHAPVLSCCCDDASKVMGLGVVLLLLVYRILIILQQISADIMMPMHHSPSYSLAVSCSLIPTIKQTGQGRRSPTKSQDLPKVSTSEWKSFPASVLANVGMLLICEYLYPLILWIWSKPALEVIRVMKEILLWIGSI